MLRTNSKKAKENLKQCVMSYYEETGIDGLRHDVEAAGGAKEFVSVGCLATYTHDMRNDLKEALEETDAQADSFDCQQVYEFYISIMARTIDEILNS